MWVIFFLFSFFTSWLLLLREMCSGVMRHVPEVEKLLISIILPARWGGGGDNAGACAAQLRSQTRCRSCLEGERVFLILLMIQRLLSASHGHDKSHPPNQ